MDYQIIIFHTTLLSQKWTRTAFQGIVEKVSILKSARGYKIAFPQDEFLNTDLLDDFFRNISVDLIGSLLPTDDWRKVYPQTSSTKASFHRVLAGYASVGSRGTSPNYSKRSIDVGYRAWEAQPWLGAHGRLKVQIANAFAPALRNAHRTYDISTEDSDTYIGAAWGRFLRNCRFVLGVEGGASVSDFDGTIRGAYESIRETSRDLSWEEYYVLCGAADREGTLNLQVITPRIFEYAANRCAMLLVEGDYNGILVPNVHYIPVKKDFSNVKEIIANLDEQVWERLTEAAYRDLITSRSWTYQTLVQDVHNEIPTEFLIRFRHKLFWISDFWRLDLVTRFLVFRKEIQYWGLNETSIGSWIGLNTRRARFLFRPGTIQLILSKMRRSRWRVDKGI